MSNYKEFEILIENLSISYWQFCLNEIMHEKIGGDIYSKHLSFWNTTIYTLEEAYLLGLARFFEKPKDLDETISIYYFFDAEQKEIINKLRRIRNKVLVHLDKKTMLKLKGGEGLKEELGLTSSDISILFDLAFGLVDKIKGNFGIVSDLKSEFKKGGEEIKDAFNVWFDIFQRGFDAGL